jgi:hypothetical protein
MGSVLIGLLVAVALRALFVKLGALEGRVLSPSILPIAVAVLVMSLAGHALSSGSADRHAPSKGAAPCSTEPSEVLDQSPANGYSLRVAPHAEERRILEQFPPVVRDRMAVRLMMKAGQRVGSALAVAGVYPADVTRGMQEGARSRGIGVEKRSIGLGPQVGDYIEAKPNEEPFAAIVAASGCVTFIVLGTEKRVVRPLAESMAAAQ